MNSKNELPASGGLNFFKQSDTLNTLSRTDWIIAGICFVIGFLFYIHTLAEGPLWGDRVEFQTLSYTLGMTHPPGYPVYLLIGKLFTLLPIADIAYRVNVMSAFFGALTLGLLYLICTVLNVRRPVSIVTAIILGVGPLFWVHSIIAEVYTIAAAIIGIEILLLLLWKQKRNWQLIFIAGCIGGLSFGIHSTIPLIAPAILVYYLLMAPKPKDWLYAFGGLAIGIVLYILFFLLIDAINAPSSYYNSVVRPSLSVWGLDNEDFNNPFKRMLFQIQAKQFSSLMFNVPINQVFTRIKEYFLSILFFFCSGLFNFFRKRWKEALFILIAYLSIMLFAFTYNMNSNNLERPYSYGLNRTKIPRGITPKYLLFFLNRVKKILDRYGFWK